MDKGEIVSKLETPKEGIKFKEERDHTTQKRQQDKTLSQTEKEKNTQTS